MQEGLPPGYYLRGYGALLSAPEEPFFWIVYGPDGRPVPGGTHGREDVEAAAWRDHRRRTLRVIRGGA